MRVRSAFTISADGCRSSCRWWFARVDERAHRFHRALHRAVDVDGGGLHVELAARDAAYVQEVVHQAREVRRLPVDHVAAPGGLRRGRLVGG
jgi:hypothetical protein